MRYYEVWVSSLKYHSDKPLTYSYDSKLETGSLVTVPLKNQTVPAVVISEVPKPKFNTKSIIQVSANRPLPKASLELIKWMAAYYPAPFGQVVATFIPTTITAKRRQTPAKSSEILPAGPLDLPNLTPEQQSAISEIYSSSKSSFLLHGDTGTGKTRVYMEIIKRCLDENKSVILLTPEIGLTPQLANESNKYFPGKTIVLHSAISAAKKRNLWLDILHSDEPVIAIGPRSALFAPVKNLGAVIIDEFHETSYKQESAPHYHATRVGAYLAKLHSAKLVLGSATPTISDYFMFSKKSLPIIRMTKSAKASSGQASDVAIVDLKDKASFKRSPWISDKLLDSIQSSINRKEQSMVFLNRRGTARVVLCQACSWSALCPRCDLPLTYHGDSHILRCHTCGYYQKSPSSCPSCKSSEILFRSIGTKSLVTELSRILPQARIARFDSDNSQKESLSRQYQKILDGKYDILVGTQMLGKGLDLPKLSVLGILAAESSLSFPDYTAEERTFQIITQTLGRINRGHTAGKAIIQTHFPDSPLIDAAINKKYEFFYNQQLNERRTYDFPPFKHTLKLTCSRASSASAEKSCRKLRDKLEALRLPAAIIGPTPAFIAKSHDNFRWQLVIKSPDRSTLISIINNHLPSKWSYDIDPINLL